MAIQRLPDGTIVATPEAGDASNPRTAKHLIKQAQANQSLRAQAPNVAGLMDSAGPPGWDRASWDAFHAATGRYPFTAEELPPNFDNCPAWAYQLMGLRPPLMAQ